MFVTWFIFQKPLRRIKIEEIGVDNEIEERKAAIAKAKSTHSQVRHETEAKEEQTFQKILESTQPQAEASGRLSPEQDDKPSEKGAVSNHSEFSIDLEELNEDRKAKSRVSSLPEPTASPAISPGNRVSTEFCFDSYFDFNKFSTTKV